MLNELTSERMKELKSERIMKNVMKTILRNTKLVMILAFLPALLSAAQAQAVDYKSTYKGVRYEQPYQQVEYKVATTATAPMAGFQSTSAYSGQFSNEQQSMLNSDGTVNNEAYMGAPKHPGSIRRDPTAPNPEVDEKDDDGNTPIGDAVWPLMLLLCAYAGYKKVRARKTQTGL
jgi:hypothetical protein